MFHEFTILPAVVYDSLIAGTDYLTVDAVQVEGADATNTIRDAVVDDATRIDASALNTLSSHDPGEAIMGATDLGTGAALTSLGSAADLATLTGYVDTEVAAILAAVDTEVAAIKTKTDYLPSATAGAAGGVFIAGSNAATTANITGNLSGSVGSVTGNVGGNVVGSVGSIAADGIAAASIATAAASKIADAILTRDWTSVTGEAARSVLNALRQLRNKVAIVTDTLTVYKEDDTTAAWTAAVTGTTGADPVTAVDPA